MPTYEYECQSCFFQFEQFQPISSPATKDCPKCNTKDKVQRLISGGINVIFKGSGFYTTDYRKSSPKSEKTNTNSEKK